MPYDKEIEEAIKGLRLNYVQANNLDTLPAVTGNKAGDLIVPFLPDHWWVRIQTSNGLSQGIHVRAPTGKVIQAKPGINVQLERDKKGRLRICEPDTDNTDASGGSVTALQQQALTPRITQDNLETLGIVPTSPPSLFLTLKSWRDVVGSAEFYFQGLLVDLTASVPSAGNMRYAVVGVKDDFLTSEITVSTERSIADVPLDKTDRNEAIALLAVGTNPAWAIKLIGGQTAVTEDDIKRDGVDLRRVVNGAPTYKFEVIIPEVSTVLGASAPSASTRAIGASGGVKAPVLQFSKTTQNDVYFEIHAPKDLVNEQSVYFHVMAFPGAGWTSGNFMLKLEYLVKNEYTGVTNTGTPTTIFYNYTPVAATEFAELEFTDAINLNRDETLVCHFYRDVANDNGDDVISIRFFEIEYTARTS